MKTRLLRVGLVVVVLAALTAAFLIGRATGQQKKYRTLPDEFSNPYTPTVLEWRMMDYNAEWAWVTAEHDKLTRRHAPVDFEPVAGVFLLVVETEPQRTWSKATFLALPDAEQKAEWSEKADRLLMELRISIDPSAAILAEEGVISAQTAKMEFCILGDGPLAKFKNGEILLPGETGFD